MCKEFTNNMKYIVLVIVLFLISFNVPAQENKPSQNYHLVRGNNFVQSKNYYLLTLFQELADVKKLLASDSILKNIAKTKADSLGAPFTSCERNVVCYLEKMKFTEAEINTVSQRLKTMYQPQNALGKLVSNHLIPSGTYILFQNLPPVEMLVKAWEQDANGINFCIGVYAGGNKPNYPAIDSIAFKIRDPSKKNGYADDYLALLYNAASLVALECKTNADFFYPSMTCAIRFLEMNEREQAADFEPMEKGENRLAFERMKTLKWDNYKYTVILVPGAGPDDPAMPFSAEGMLRCRLAAIEYKNGLAPFIVVSGGKVHPYKTKYCEATEMKKYLLETLGIPENAILIDPHARHTTTNMRNVARMMYRYGVPFERPGVTCTTKWQSEWIGSTLTARCLRELNEAPYKPGLRLSETLVAFFPLVEALQINPLEPMDP
jgi:hypothetical protein